MSIMKGILDAFKMLALVVALIGGIYLSLFVVTLVIGVVFNLALAGSINVSTATITSMNNTFNSFTTMITVISTALAFTGSLLTVAIVLLVFGGIFAVGKEKYKKSSKGGEAYFGEGKQY